MWDRIKHDRKRYSISFLGYFQTQKLGGHHYHTIFQRLSRSWSALKLL